MTSNNTRLPFVDITSHTGLQTGLTIFTVWLCWYTWKFALSPLLNPNEPQELPHLIPFVGHAYSMMTGAHRMFSKGRTRFNKSPYRITVMGQTIYIIDKPEDVLAVYKAPKALDFDPVVKTIFQKYGLAPDSIAKIFDAPGKGSKNWADSNIDMFKTALHPGPHLDSVEKVLLHELDEALTWKNLSHTKLSNSNDQDGKIVSLYDWCASAIVESQTCSLFDPVIFDGFRDLSKTFQEYEEEAWKLPLDLPYFMTTKLKTTQAYIENALIRYMSLPEERRAEESWMIRTLCQQSKELDLGPRQSAKILFSIYRVVNANAYKLVFWVMSYILFDDQLREDIRQEIEPAFSSGPSPDLKLLFNKFPLLASTCEEALRLSIWSVGARTVMSDTIIGSKRLNAGRQLLMPYRAMHFDPDIFGSSPDQFNPRRFMEKPTLVKSTSYRPFGGATHYCPGRFIASKEVQMCVAVMLMRFDLEVVGKGDGTLAMIPGKKEFPKMDDTMPSGGILAPSNGERLVVKITRRKGYAQ